MAQIIGELGLRFPPSHNDDAADAKARLKLLMEDVSDIPVNILEPACRTLAKSARFLPTAAEIVTASREELDRRDTRPSKGDRDASISVTARRYNQANAEKGKPHRWSDRMDMFCIGEPGEARGAREDGSVIEPWFRDGDWYVRRDDVQTLAACYRAHDAAYVVRADGLIRAAERLASAA